MIAVAGFNTSIDRLLRVDDLVPGAVLRAQEAYAWPGGKGVHVALGIAALGEQVRVAGFVDAVQHDWFRSWLAARAIEFQGIEFDGPVRTCLTIQDRHGGTTEIREPGPMIGDDLWRAAVSVFERLSLDASVAVLSGSVPPGVSTDAYRQIASLLAPRRVLVDAAGELLRSAVEGAPFCIKPNREEAEGLTRMTLDTIETAARAVRTLAVSGVPLVIVSLGAAGAVACWNGAVCQVTAPPVVAINVVGAGDCPLGGVAVGLARGLDIEEVLRLGVACGTAKVRSPEIGVVRREDVEAILPATRLSWL